MKSPPKTGNAVIDACLVAWSGLWSWLSWLPVKQISPAVGLLVSVLTAIMLAYRILLLHRRYVDGEQEEEAAA